ncbi:MAG TPA: WecB/TagA/CpsF family glycosyltransferase [Terracidiphilus sp.]|nr:WecB/TagA/CpsF family glycosyltransferase [Terracidiphilus sp.]
MPHRDSKRRRILGVNFYVGDANGAIDRIARGGLLVVPAAPALKEIAHNAAYRAALLEADLAITDSAFMVLAWNIMERDSIRRLSGLEYLRELLKREDVRKPGNTLWIMAAQASAEKNLAWLREQGIEVPQECVYLAPMYGEIIEDRVLLEKIDVLRVKHVVVTIGGGTQERLGHYLKLNLSYLPAIHCIGAAIAFLSGDQVRIPMWADRFYLGWLLRCLASPRRFVPRYLSARNLLPLLWRFRSRLPVEG